MTSDPILWRLILVCALAVAAVSVGVFLRYRAMQGLAAAMRYYLILPNYGHSYNLHPNNDPAERFLRSLPEYLGRHLTPPWFRFVAVVRDGGAGLYLGLPAGAGRQATRSFRSAFPEVDLVPLPPGERPPFPWDAPDTIQSVRYRLAAPSPFPLATGRGSAAFEAVLRALGAGMRVSVAGIFDVCFTPVNRSKYLEEPGRKTDSKLAVKVYGQLEGPERGAVKDLTGVLKNDPVVQKIFGAQGAGRAAAGMQSREAIRVMQQPERAMIEDIQKKYDKQRAWRVSVRAAAVGRPDEVADALRSVTDALGELEKHNKLVPEFSPYSGNLLRFIREGALPAGEGVVLCTSELAQLIPVPGQESSLWERGLERAAAKTLAPPQEMLGPED